MTKVDYGPAHKTDFEKLIFANILVRTLKRKNESLIRMNLDLVSKQKRYKERVRDYDADILKLKEEIRQLNIRHSN